MAVRTIVYRDVGQVVAGNAKTIVPLLVVNHVLGLVVEDVKMVVGISAV